MSRTRVIRRLAWALLLATAAAGAQDPAAWRVHVETPDVLGYTVGDVIRHRARIVLDAPYRLDEGSLPRARRLSSWLEIRSVELDVDRGIGSTAYDIEIAYQVLNTTPKVSAIATPPVSLTVLAGDETFPVVIPAWGFSVLPVAVAEEVPPGTLPALRPPLAPPPMDLHTYELRITILSVAVLAGLAYLVHLNGSLPLLRRSNGPFARAHRRLKYLRRRCAGEPASREAYRYLHAAFNETAGRVLLADDLDDFFDTQPRFRGIRASVEAFYADSRQVFFSGEVPERGDATGMAALLRLARRFRDAERGLA